MSKKVKQEKKQKDTAPSKAEKSLVAAVVCALSVAVIAILVTLQVSEYIHKKQDMQVAVEICISANRPLRNDDIQYFLVRKYCEDRYE